MNRLRALSIHIPSLFLSICSFASIAQAQWHQADTSVMGTKITATLWHPEKKAAEDLIQQVFSEMRRIDETYSPYKPESTLSTVNREAKKRPIRINQEFFQLLNISRSFSELSNGLFDISFDSVGKLYDFQTGMLPTNQALENSLPHINYKAIILNHDQSTVFFNNPHISIDLGGIAKGFAVDLGIELLKRKNITEAVVSAGGDSRYLGSYGNRPWHMGIRHPRDASKTALMIPIENAAVSTSGDYERFFIDDQGKRHHHIIDPSTGRSPKSGVVSVTVIGNQAVNTDALSTTLFIAGIKKGLNLIDQIDDTDAIFIDTEGKVHFSQGLAPPENSTQSMKPLNPSISNHSISNHSISNHSNSSRQSQGKPDYAI